MIFEFVPQPVTQIPWGHNRLIISKLKSIPDALFYCEQVGKMVGREIFLRQ
jgi:hypothetical protein